MTGPPRRTGVDTAAMRARMLRYVADHPAMRRLGTALDTALGHPAGTGSRRLAEMGDHVLGRILADYHNYMTEVMGHIDDRLVPLLIDLHDLRNGRRLPADRSPATQRADLEELESAIHGMRDLGEHVQQILGSPDHPLARQLREELAATAPAPARHWVRGGSDPLAGPAGPGPAGRILVERAAERFPEQVRNALAADTHPALLRRLAELRARLAGELSQAQLDALDDAVHQLNPYGRRVAGDGRPGGMSEEADRARFDAAVAGIRQPGLRAEVAGSPYLARIAYESPHELREQWVRWRLDGERHEFWKWMFFQRNPVRGRHGEFQAAFGLGKDFLLIKAPKFVTTGSGTDLVVLDRRTGRILLIDNKAWQNPVVDRVDALTTNLLTNIGEDARLAYTAAGGADVPDELNQVAARLREAAQELENTLRGRRPDSPEGREMTRPVLAERRIDLVVTGEGGRAGDLTEALTAFGLELRDLTDRRGE